MEMSSPAPHCCDLELELEKSELELELELEVLLIDIVIESKCPCLSTRVNEVNMSRGEELFASKSRTSQSV